MSGWDEGAIHYSDQAQFPHGAAGETEQDQGAAASRHVILRKFQEFIRNFPHKSRPNVYPYREALLENPKYLLVNMSDLLAYERDQTLPELLRQNPADYLPLVWCNFLCVQVLFKSVQLSANVESVLYRILHGFCCFFFSSEFGPKWYLHLSTA